MAESVAWYLALVIVGTGGWLPAAYLLDRLDSRGVWLARPLALAITALVAWLLVRLTPLTYGTPVVLVALLALFAWSGWIAWRRPEVPRALVERWHGIAAAEATFLLLLVGLILLRSGTPDAWATEKPGDLMFLTSVHRAEAFPPADPWLSGTRLSYYHLGQVQADVVGRISGNGPDTTFNLATASAGAAAGTAVVGLAMDLVALGIVTGQRRRRARLIAGAIALLGLLLVAPLIGTIQILAANGVGGDGAWGWLGITGVPTTGGSENGVPSEFWWWWPTTRALPSVIAEYPAFTVILGDPHAHLLAVPLGMIALALAVQVFEGSTPLTWRRWLRQPERLLLTAMVFAALVMTNAWDVITYGGIWGLAALWATARTGWSPHLAAFIAARWAAVPAALAGVLAWPFLRTLDPNPIGLTPVVGEFSDPGRWLLVWLPVCLPALAGVLLIRPRRGSRYSLALGAATVPVLIWALWLLKDGHASELVYRGAGWTTIAGLVIATGWCIAAAATADARDRALAGGLALLGAGALVGLATELIQVNDAFPGRLNTVFKFWFHVWTIVAIGGGVLAGIAAEQVLDAVRGGNRWASRAVMVVTAGALTAWGVTMLTPAAMAVSREREGQERGLDAIAYLERSDPALAATIAWARATLDPEHDVMTQAIGEAYSSGNLLAAYTGIPTLLGWPGHERQWRGEIGETERRAALEAIYTGTLDEALVAAHKWGVTYVYVSSDEIAEYGPGVADRFDGWAIPFQAPAARVYEVPPP